MNTLTLTPADIEALADCQRYGATKTYRERRVMLNGVWDVMSKVMMLSGKTDAQRLAMLQHAMPSLVSVLCFLGSDPDIALETAQELVETNLHPLAVRDGNAHRR